MKFSEIRPVGDKLSLNAQPFDSSLFTPFSAVLYQSGTAALAAAIMALRASRPDIENPHMLMPAYTCPDVISACKYAGVEAHLVDFEKHRSWMDLEQLKNSLSENTLGILAINFLGLPERIGQIKKLAGKSMPIIEDSAQGFTESNRSSYWQGDLITLSFGRGKPLGLFGGGAVLYQTNRWRELLPQTTSHMVSPTDQWVYRIKVGLFNLLSSPFCYYFLTRMPFLSIGETHYKELQNLSDINPAIKNQLMQRVQWHSELSSSVEAYYADELCDLTHVVNLPQQSLANPVKLLRYPVLIPDQSRHRKIIRLLTSKGYGCSRMYQKILPKMDDLPENMVQFNGQLKNADEFANSLITLPCHQGISMRQAEKVVAIIKAG